ncbi:MAG: ATP synthase F1 subunit gamma [Elusimicrobiota bacterium]
MASLRELRNKLKSVKSTQQITKAMKMVAAARMRRAQGAILASRPFAVKLEEAVGDLSRLEAAAKRVSGIGGRLHPFFGGAADSRDAGLGERLPASGLPREGAGERGAAGLILVTADKGLCGSFNANILRAAVQWIRGASGRPISVAVAGRKGRDLLQRLRDVPLERPAELVGIFPKATYAHAELLAEPMIERFVEGRLDSVALLYTEFQSVVSQKVVEKRILPIPAPEAEADEAGGFGFHYEPGREKLLEALLPRHIKAQIFRALLESQAAELAARMNAMDAATKNAGELIDNLTLCLNRTRQAIITREIVEIVSGAEALGG